MINTYADHLIAQAKQHWDREEPCPVDIIAKLYAEGIDASALEDQYDADRDADELFAEIDEALEDNLTTEEETHG